MDDNEPVNHHYVPQFLLNRWAMSDPKGQRKLPTHYWDKWRGQARVHWAGSTALCCADGLYSLSPDAADRAEIERYFQKIDEQGAAALNKVVEVGAKSLSILERRAVCDFLGSLVSRRPTVVASLRDKGTGILKKTIDRADIRAMMLSGGIIAEPVAYFEAHQGSLEDRAVSILKGLTASAKTRAALLKMNWHILVADGEQELALSDQPLVRSAPLDNPRQMWSLALGPRHLFVATTLQGADFEKKGHAMAKWYNTHGADSADSRVVLRETVTPDWLAKRLRHRAELGPRPLKLPSVEKLEQEIGGAGKDGQR